MTKDLEIFLTFSKMLFSPNTLEKFIHEHKPSESLQHESGSRKKFCFSASVLFLKHLQVISATGEGVYYCETQKIVNTWLQSFSPRTRQLAPHHLNAVHYYLKGWKGL